MNEPVRKVKNYLESLSPASYNISGPVFSFVNYLLDSYWKKLDERALIHSSVDRWYPSDPESHIKELWLSCEVHNLLTLNKSYPSFAKNLHAWAFSKMFSSSTDPNEDYEIIPFMDSYEFKAMLKGSYNYRIQYEQLSIDFQTPRTLPVYGSFFVTHVPSGSHILIKIDLAHNSNDCVFTAMVKPSDQLIAEQFFRNLDSSMRKNDIYFKKCLSFIQGRLDFMDVIPTGWKDIILKKNVVDSIRDNTVEILDHISELSSIGMCPNRNVILISPPGMAKTTIFRAISDETNGRATRIWCTGKSIERSEHVIALFQAARSLAPCIIFIEDMDLFGRDRSQLSGGDSRVLNEFLACLDGTSENSGVVVMASTNDIASMDQALVARPGRFDVKIEVPIPDFNDRKIMLHSFLKKFNAEPDHSVTPDTIKVVVELTDSLTGAYIKDLAKQTVIRAVAEGRLVNGTVCFSADDLNAAAQQTVDNYRIGLKAKSHHITLKSD